MLFNFITNKSNKKLLNYSFTFSALSNMQAMNNNKVYNKYYYKNNNNKVYNDYYNNNNNNNNKVFNNFKQFKFREYRNNNFNYVEPFYKKITNTNEYSKYINKNKYFENNYISNCYNYNFKNDSYFYHKNHKQKFNLNDRNCYIYNEDKNYSPQLVEPEKNELSQCKEIFNSGTSIEEEKNNINININTDNENNKIINIENNINTDNENNENNININTDNDNNKIIYENNKNNENNENNINIYTDNENNINTDIKDIYKIGSKNNNELKKKKKIIELLKLNSKKNEGTIKQNSNKKNKEKDESKDLSYTFNIDNKNIELTCNVNISKDFIPKSRETILLDRIGKVNEKFFKVCKNMTYFKIKDVLTGKFDKYKEYDDLKIEDIKKSIICTIYNILNINGFINKKMSENYKDFYHFDITNKYRIYFKIEKDNKKNKKNKKNNEKVLILNYIGHLD